MLTRFLDGNLRIRFPITIVSRKEQPIIHLSILFQGVIVQIVARKRAWNALLVLYCLLIHIMISMKGLFPKQILLSLLIVVAVICFWEIGRRASHEPLKWENEEAEVLRPADHFYELRSYPDGKFDLAAYEAALHAAADGSQKMASTASFTSAPWRLEGPTNIGGRINAIAVDPNNASVMLVGCSAGGIFKTTDAGNSWAPIFDGQTFLAIGDITFAPGSSTVVYAGTGDPNVSGYPFIGDGVYKSTDAGATWTHLGLANTRIVSRIIIDPTNPNKIYVSTMGLPMERNNNRGLYVSSDGGMNWVQSLFISNQAGVIDLVMDPNNSQILYASSWDRIRTNQESTIDGLDAKIFKTTNGGTTWTQLTNGLPSWPQSRINLARHPTNSAILYASYIDTTLFLANIYKTTNSGASWAPMDISTLDPGALGGFGWYFGNVFVNPFEPNEIYLLGVQLWRTTDDGATWNIVDPSWWMYDVHADKHDMHFTGPNAFSLATDGGLYRTTDDGITWSDADEIPNSQAYRVAVNPHATQSYTAGLQDNGTTNGNHLSLNTWPRIYGGDGFQPIYDANPDHLVAETQNGNLVYTEDGGFSFNDFTLGIDPIDRRNWDMPVIRSAFDQNVYYTGTYRIYKNVGGLASHYWDTVSTDLTDGVVFAERFHTITTIAESPLTAQLVYAGTSDGNLSRSTDAGATWTNITNGIPDRYVTSIKASPMAVNEVFVTVSGYKYNDFIPHLLRSTNQGSTWTDVSGDLPQLALNDVLIHPTIDSIWVVASDAGVYATRNAGINWARVGTQMPYCPVYDMDWDLPGRRLLAGTHARSLMTFSMDTLEADVIIGVPDPRGAQFQLYPNPAHDRTQLHGASVIDQWSILDAQGRRLRQGKVPGNEATLDLGGIAAGVYFVRIETTGIVFTKRLVIQ